MVMPGWKKPKPEKVEVPKVRTTRFRVVNLYLKDADTEYSWQVPRGLTRFNLQVRDNVEIRVATREGLVAGSNEPYFTLKPGCVWSEGQLEVTEDQLIYFASSLAGNTVEILLMIEEEI